MKRERKKNKKVKKRSQQRNARSPPKFCAVIIFVSWIGWKLVFVIDAVLRLEKQFEFRSIIDVTIWHSFVRFIKLPEYWTATVFEVGSITIDL